MFNLFAAYGNIEDIEVLFTLLAFTGATYSLFSVIESIRDYAFIRRARIGNGRRTLAWASIHTEAARFIVQVIFMTLGILAMLLPTVPPTHLSTLAIVFGAVFRWGLVTSTALLLYKSVLAHVVRQRLRHERIERQAVYNDKIKAIEEQAAEHDPLTQPIQDSPLE